MPNDNEWLNQQMDEATVTETSDGNGPTIVGGDEDAVAASDAAGRESWRDSDEDPWGTGDAAPPHVIGI